MPAARTSWFKGNARLIIGGSTRVWGPWSPDHPIWELSIEPGETKSIVLEPGTATAAERELASATAAYNPPPPTDPTGAMWDIERFAAPPKTWPAEGITDEGVRGVFYEGPAYRGRPTRIFAWIGLPDVPAGQKVPGMVLVHGGGGTAFASWVRLWTSRGYAAIAMDTCGSLPTGSHSNRPRHEFGGPPGWGGWGQIAWPREDQWTFHAVAAALLGHSLLRSLPEVDPARVGLTGISWGGYLTSILAGVDPRYKLAVPVYGCGFTNEHGFAGSVANLGPEGAARWMRWWDPSVYLPKVKMPMLWVTGSNDFAYTLNALQKSYRLPTSPRTLAVRLRMPHGHGAAGEGPKEIHVFADSILKGGPPLPRITAQGQEGTTAWATFESPVKVVRAELNITRDRGKWQERKWDALPATLAGNRASAALPDGVTVYYLNLFDERDCVVSTEHVELTG
ncbi:MAG: acetylxylan esterase [Armatimonadetes bacterium]|nr:acetylxylan esterase [Armatimonadota bacterium]